MPKNKYKSITAVSLRHRRRLRNNSNFPSETPNRRQLLPGDVSIESQSNLNNPALSIVHEEPSAIFSDMKSETVHSCEANNINRCAEISYPPDRNISGQYEDREFLSVSADLVEEWIPDSETDESDEEIEEHFCVENFKQELRDWAVEGVALTKVNSLLKILKSHDCFSSLPTDSRTLLKTPRSTNVKDVGGGGKYCHFGIKEKVFKIINIHPLVRECVIIKLQTNVDGLPLSKSSRSHLWPILIALEDFDFIPPFVAGVFHGTSKPESIEIYLEDYVQEVSTLIEDGVECMGRNYKICITSYICDAPARAFLAQIKGHTGYYSCSKCKIKGVHSSKGVIFDKFESPQRTHEDFVNKTDEQHHLPNKTSPLIVIPGINMVDHFPFEYMHLVCLGVMRKILYSFMKGTNYKVRLSTTILDQLSVRIVNLRPHIPSKFGRKPRSLQELLRWKATEFRQILLYTSPLVFPKFLSDDVYNHFISLHYAIRILSSRLYACQQLQYARSLLKYFVSNFPVVYSLTSLSYNVHGLLHLVDDVELHGPLDKFSAFKFENKLQQLKKLIRKHDKPLQQIARRIFEKEMAMKDKEVCNYPVFKEESCINSALPLGLENPIYNSIEFKHFKITKKRPNNCVIMENGDICVVQYIANKFGKPHFIGQKFKDVSDFYSKPGSSQVIGIHCAKDLSQTQLFPVSEIKNKALMIPLDPHNADESFYIAEMLHSS